MGRLLTEPVWIFYRGTQAIDHITQLKGKRILIGPEGSGTNSLAKKLLDANGVTPENSKLIAMELPAYPDALSSNNVDAGFLVLGAEAKTVQKLLRQPDVRLMNMAQADALIQRYPYLSAVTLRQGVIDFAKNIPSADTSLVATKAMLLIRDDLHPALRTLLADAVVAAQSQPTLKPTGEAKLFTLGTEALADDPEFTISDDVRRVYKSGPTFFQRVLPFWVATLFDRAFILLLPVIGIIVPLFRVVPGFYNWRMRQRILRWYRALKLLERDLAKNTVTPEFIDARRRNSILSSRRCGGFRFPISLRRTSILCAITWSSSAGGSPISGRGSRSQLRSQRRSGDPWFWRGHKRAEFDFSLRRASALAACSLACEDAERISSIRLKSSVAK